MNENLSALESNNSCRSHSKYISSAFQVHLRSLICNEPAYYLRHLYIVAELFVLKRRLKCLSDTPDSSKPLTSDDDGCKMNYGADSGP